jgi:hypothetical protein
VHRRAKKKEMTECKNGEDIIRASLDCKKERKKEKTVDRLLGEREKEKKRVSGVSSSMYSSYIKDVPILYPLPSPFQAINNDVITGHMTSGRMTTMFISRGHAIQTSACCSH